MATHNQISRKSTSAQVGGHKCKNQALLCFCALWLLLAGCKDDGKKEALAEAAKARAEAVKLKAEIIRLEGQRSNLIYRLQANELEKETITEQLHQLFDEQDIFFEEAHETQKEIEDLEKKLAEQTKKAAELEKQVEQLKAVIRELQSTTGHSAEDEQLKEEI
ncbi:MAG: hypothetical protein JW749_12445 [Sedimentisphaerales bacterium]|nr:hypothetical protein [Sedimentisphaerales bacterium]